MMQPTFHRKIKTKFGKKDLKEKIKKTERSNVMQLYLKDYNHI